jgi:beta-lactamase class A
MTFQYEFKRFNNAGYALIFLLNIVFSSYVNASPIIKKIEQFEKDLGARIGVSIYDVSRNKSLFDYRGDVRFPLMSTFKTLACAKLLADVDKGNQSLKTAVVIKESSLITWSPVTKNHLGEEFSLLQACTATMIMSDNTAANIVLDHINGPKSLTQFMRSIGDEVTRLDRIEPFLGEAMEGDVRDTTTPNAIARSLNELLFGSTLSATSKAQIK